MRVPVVVFAQVPPPEHGQSRMVQRTLDALRVFDIVYGLTGGGPGTTTDTLSSFAYKFYFTFVQFGRGSAYAIITFLLVTHDRNLAARMDRCLELHMGQLREIG